MVNIILFLQFIKYGLLCFGGGYMIIPLLYVDFVQTDNIFTPESYGNILAISQMTPGAVSINTATYVGYIKNGLFGAIFATMGLCFPTYILTTIVMNYLYKYKDSPVIIGFFKGAKWAALIMIIYAIIVFSNISIFENTINNITAYTSNIDNMTTDSNFKIKLPEIIIAICCIPLAKKISLTLLIILSAIIGYGISFIC